MSSTASPPSGHDPGLRERVATQLHERLGLLLIRAAAHDPRALAPLAELRRAAGRPFGATPGADAALLRLVTLPLDDRGDPPRLGAGLSRLLEDALLVASLVATTRTSVRSHFAGRRGSFGADLRPLRRTRENAARSLAHAVLGADREDLDVHLRRAASLLGADGHGLDAGALLRDLGAWGAEGHRVQRRWAYDFWADARPESTDDHEGEQA